MWVFYSIILNGRVRLKLSIGDMGIASNRQTNKEDRLPTGKTNLSCWQHTVKDEIY